MKGLDEIRIDPIGFQMFSDCQPLEAWQGTLRAELVGDLATAVAPHRFESK
jgi:hypothetical protein